MFIIHIPVHRKSYQLGHSGLGNRQCISYVLSGFHAANLRSKYLAGVCNVLKQLPQKSQGHRSATAYAADFRTFSTQSRWNDVTLKAVFEQSLNARLQKEIACRGKATHFTNM